jgi:GNAT superfamily N-acetyltransferase
MWLMVLSAPSAHLDRNPDDRNGPAETMTQTQAISQDIRMMMHDEPDPVQAAVHFLCGEKVTVRPARPQDTGMIQGYMRGLSSASRRNRFLGSLNEVSANELYSMTHTNRCSHPALIVENVVEGACTMIGEARYAVAPDGFRCEFAVSVKETWRRKKLGTLLVGIVANRARGLGLHYLVGDVFHSNEAMTALARKTKFAVTGPVGDARLVKITKDLSLLDTTRPWSGLNLSAL